MLQRFLREEDGQDALEYGLLGALIGIAAILIWQALATQVGTIYGAAVAPAGPVQTLSACTPDPGGGGC